MKNTFFIVVAVCSIGLLLQPFSVVEAQDDRSVSHTFEVTELDQATLEYRSRLSEKYIQGTISPEELRELTDLRPNFADLDRYKAEYEEIVTSTTTVEVGDTVTNVEESVMTGSDLTLPEEVVPADSAPLPETPVEAPTQNYLLPLLIIMVIINLLLGLFILLKLKKNTL